MCPPDPSGRLNFVDGMVSCRMGSGHRRENSHRGNEFPFFTGREFPQHIAQCGIYVGFIEGHPVLTKAATSPRASTTRRAKRRNNAAASEERNPPRCSNHTGWLKW